MAASYDHYIYAAHVRRWATNNRVTVLRRIQGSPRTLEVGKMVAAEQGLNAPWIEGAYGKVEDLFNRALPRLIDPTTEPTDRDWQAVREYAVLMHDRYPGLRGTAADDRGLPGGNAMMVPNPANWGRSSGVSGPIANLATTMDREQLKAVRMQLLPLNARLLPRVSQVLHVGPILLGDAGIHAIGFHTGPEEASAYVAMPLSPEAIVVFGDQIVGDEEAVRIAGALNMKVATESTIVIDTMEAPIIKGFVAEMWRSQAEPSGLGVPSAVHLWSRVEDIPQARTLSAEHPDR